METMMIEKTNTTSSATSNFTSAAPAPATSTNVPNVPIVPIEMGVQNILLAFSLATPQEIAKGMEWYATARGFCESLAMEHNLPIDIPIAVLSALSPRNKWMQNLKDTINVLQAAKMNKLPQEIKCSTFHSNKYKAFNIIKQNNPLLVNQTLKTKSFAHNIKHINSNLVTVDVHALSIYNGKRTQAQPLKPIQYQQVQKAYQIAADKLNLMPYNLQAITWLVNIRRNLNLIG